MNKDGYCLEFLENSGSIKLTDPNGRVIVEQYPAAEGLTFSQISSNADVWLWNDDAMDLLYSETTPYSVPSKEQLEKRVEIARDMVSSGMTDVLWSAFNENIDRETVSKIKELGYLTTYYDIYTDVIPADIFSMIPTTRQKRCEKRLPLWPNGIIRDSEGGLTLLPGEYDVKEK